MSHEPPRRSSLDDKLRRVPIHAIRDTVTKRPSSGRNLDALDGIRGLAVLLVVAAHTDGLHMRGHGAAGVWMFFALSAFLLTLPFAANPDRIKSPREIGRYFSRRIRRILPAYYFAIVVQALLFGAGATFVIRHLTFQRATGIFWTIPQEVLFYLLLPGLVALHPFVFRRNHFATIAGLGALAVAAAVWLTGDVFALHGNGKLLRFNLPVFLVGMMFAYAVHTPALNRIVARRPVARALDLAGLVSLGLLVFSAPWYVERLSDALPALDVIPPKLGLGNRNVFALFSGVLIYVTTVCERGVTRRVLRALPLRLLGLVSFSLYLFHVMVQTQIGFQWLELRHGNTLFLVTLGVSYAVAGLVYSVIERPYLSIRVR